MSPLNHSCGGGGAIPPPTRKRTRKLAVDPIVGSKKMTKKITFTITFTLVHAVVTMIVCANALGSSFLVSLPRSACKIIGIILACPVLVPCIMLDPDGDSLPKWFQVSSFFLNSLIWAGLILLLIAASKRYRSRTNTKGTQRVRVCSGS